jgi:hypothetical protein
MRMIRRSAHARVVTSSKARSAIPAAKRPQRDLVIQSLLDPSVRAVEFLHRVVHEGHAVETHSIVVHRDDGAFFLEVAGLSPERDPLQDRILDEGLKANNIHRMQVAPDELRREPRYSNARLIWQKRETPVSGRDRERILDHLAETGPLELGKLMADMETSIDIVAAVSALACDDAVDIDIDTVPLGRETIVRLRR